MYSSSEKQIGTLKRTHTLPPSTFFFLHLRWLSIKVILFPITNTLFKKVIPKKILKEHYSKIKNHILCNFCSNKHIYLIFVGHLSFVILHYHAKFHQNLFINSWDNNHQTHTQTDTHTLTDTCTTNQFGLETCWPQNL